MTRKNDEAMLAIARMQLLLEKNMAYLRRRESHTFQDDPEEDILNECYKIIKKANIPKKYLLAESLDSG